MRLRRLEIGRFGHFSDRAFDFGDTGAPPDFHIVYGPNEAGKTTTMESVLRLFYGFPHREPYDFRHGRPNLQVSATLEIDGDTQRFTRLPRKSGALLDGSGVALPEAALSAHLGGLSEDDYRKLLCLDDETIERGGQEIAEAKGDIGRLLFSAAAGVADLSRVLDGVREEADGLWRKRASKTRIAELKRTLKDIDAQIREGDVSASAWKTLKADLSRAQAHEDQVRSDLSRQRGALAVAEGRQRALPRLANLDTLDETVARFAAFPERLDFDPEDLVGLTGEARSAEADRKRLLAEIERLERDAAALERTPRLLALPERLEALEELRSRETTAALDIEKRRDAVREAEAAMARAAADLGVAEGADLGAPIPSAAAIAVLEAAREELRSAERAAETEAEEHAKATERLAGLQADLDRVEAGAPPDAGLDAILARHDADGLSAEYAAARQARDAAATAADTALQALARGVQRLDALPDCPTSVAQAAHWVDEAAALRIRIEQARAARDDHRADARSRAAQAERMTADAGLVDDAEAERRMAERERRWQAHRAAPDAASAARFEEAMRAVDDAARARLGAAAELGRMRQVREEEAGLRARERAASDRLAEAEAGARALRDTVAEAARSVGRDDLVEPEDWRAWVDLHAAATQAARHAATVESETAPVRARAEALLAQIAPLLDPAPRDFESALREARARAEAERAARETLRAARSAVEAAKETATERRRRLADREAQVRDARAAWAETVADTCGGAVAPDALIPGLQPLRDLREAAQGRSEKLERIRTMERDRDRFAEAVVALAREFGVDPAPAPLQTFAALSAAGKAARDAEAEHTRIQTALAKAQADLAQADATLERIAGDIDAMGRAFPEGTPVATLEELRGAALQAEEVIAARRGRDAEQKALVADLDLPDIASARAALHDVTAAGLVAEIAGLSDAIAAQEKLLTAATEARVTAAQALAAVTGDARIARLRERRATVELELEEAARDHLELAVGLRLADAAIRRYRDAHRSGMMQSTERSFCALTGGAYVRLSTQPEGDGEALLAVDGQGATKRVAEMSKGTRFQLYLALRAAAHEQMVAQGVRLPFFCDDIFETFDEDRTAAACRIMDAIGRQGQAIYLTHHRHVVDIARAVCPVPPTVHELG